jgi:hypothetical protein
VSPYAFDMKYNIINITTKTKINREIMGSYELNLQCNVTNITTKAKRDRLWVQVGSTCNKKKPQAY